MKKFSAVPTVVRYVILFHARKQIIKEKRTYIGKIDFFAQNILSVIISDFIKNMNKDKINNIQADELNKEFLLIINKLIKPLIKEDTSISILGLINKAMTKSELYYKFFGINRDIFSRNIDSVIIF